ncbi:phage integrase [Sphingomonas sp. DBB INV C78]|uniref:tyrosine-type recombinase/integrase n=1 Tax=Sphingomonas sp. DBB INV C78 TaxID=3349434 RepID=UPI0036D36A9A
MARQKALTPGVIDALNCVRVCDPQTPGLQIEALPGGRKRWQYRRRLPRTSVVVKLVLGTFPAHSIAAAREWAAVLNEQVEAGIDPREERARLSMTVARAHGLYMQAVREGRSSRAKRINKPRTIAEKIEIFQRDVAPTIGQRVIYDVTETDLVRLVDRKGKTAKVRANRLAVELKVFFGWAASLRGTEVGLEIDPARRLGDLKYPETPRTRTLTLEEIGWFLQGLVHEEHHFQRGMLLWLLTAARLSEVIRARWEEIVDGISTIPASRAKNTVAHTIALGPLGRSLMQTNDEWVFPAEKCEGPRTTGWYKARDRVRLRMEQQAGRPIERFTPHDFRRTARSNTKRLNVDYETAEAMLNHVKKGMERTYDLYGLEEEKRAWFLRWENEIAGIARRVRVAGMLGLP